MKARLKRDIVIPKGTIFEDDGVVRIDYGPDHVMISLPFGKDATGDLRVGTEFGNRQFDEWFEIA
jgi:hypothetical protein